MKPNDHKIHKQHTFDSFCKKVLRNETRDFYDEVKRQREREIPFSEISARDKARLVIMDEYPSESYLFQVLGYDIAIRNEIMAEAIAALSEKKRDIILLSIFLDMSDTEIGKRLNIVRRTVQYKRTSSLKELKERLEGKEID